MQSGCLKKLGAIILVLFGIGIVSSVLDSPSDNSPRHESSNSQQVSAQSELSASEQNPIATSTLLAKGVSNDRPVDGEGTDGSSKDEKAKQKEGREVAKPSPAATQKETAPAADVDGEVTAHFLSVGQGDSEFLVLNDGTTILIDAGESWAGDSVVWYVRDVLGFDHIDWLVASHPHADHIGGVPSILYSNISCDNILALEVSSDTEAFWGFLNSVEASGKQITPATAGLVIHDEAGCRVEVLSPQAGNMSDDINDCSIVLKVSFGNTVMLFSGDASWKVVGSLDVGHVDVLKVGHHGSDASVSIPLLEALSPSIAVIEVGWGNDYGLPNVETLDELAYCGVQTWRTDVDGIVIVTSDGNRVSAVSNTGSSLPMSRAEIDAKIRAEEEAAAQAAAAEAAAIAQAQAEGEAAYEAAIVDSYGAGRTVYITDTGAKYHTHSCRYLKDSCYAIGINDAKAMGYEPCKVCKPGN